LSSMHWSDAPVTPDPVRRGSSSDSLTQGMADDMPVAICRQRREPRLSRCRGRTIVGGFGGRESRGCRDPEADCRGSEGAVGLVHCFRGYRYPDLTPHAALSSELGLGSTAPHGCPSWAQCRAQRSVTPAPSCPRLHGADVTPRLVGHSAVLRRRVADIVGVVGWYILSGKLVKAAVMGSMSSQPRASR